MNLISLNSVTLRLGGPALLDGVDLRITKGERICLLGRNGEGKSTLLDLLAGGRAPDAGEIVRARDLRVGLLPQTPPTGLTGPVRDLVLQALGGDPARAHEADQAAGQLGLDPAADLASLSTGAVRRALLARALAGDPDLLLLDEPTNHLDIDAIDRVEELLGRFRGAVVFVTHDRAFLRRLARRILELDRGRLRDWTCDYDTFLRRRDEALREESVRQDEFDKKLAQEEVWIRQGVRERRTRNEGRVRALLAMREERRARREQQGAASFGIQEGERGGRLVFRARGLTFGYDGPPVIDGLDLTVLRGDKLGVVGPNGCGKTTLRRLLLGELAPRSGTVERGANLQVAYYDQRHEALDETRSVIENVTGGPETVRFDGRDLHVVSYLKQFLFAPERLRTPITHLSGGERNRLLLARLFTQPANLLVLDEPTNDLDLETLELLEELLLDYKGTVLLVSHDRDFLDHVATSTLVFTPDGIHETVGGWSDWRLSRRGAPARPVCRPEAKPKAPPARPAQDRPRKLRWKEERELEALPGRLEELEAAKDALHARLADPGLYREAGEAVAALRADLERLEAELEAAYARWEELEALREDR